MSAVKAKVLYEMLNENEKTIAHEILKALHGLELSRATWLLDFCKEAAGSTATVMTDQ